MDRKYTHIIEPFPVNPAWTRYRVMDWGYSKPFSIGWYALDSDGVAYRYREWYGCTGEPDVGLRLTPEQVADEIKKIEAELEPDGVFINGVADPAIFHSDTGKSIAETFAEKGVYFQPADNSRLTGWNQMRSRMQFDHEGRARLYVFKTCKHWTRTIPALIHDETKVEDLDTKQEDHQADETRYFCMARPVSARILVPKPPKLYNPLDSDNHKETYGLGIYL
jgi:hypothetical protein